MSKRPWILAPRWLVAVVAASLLAPPAQAERWHDLKMENETSSRIDLDSLKREGNMVTYRAEFIRYLPNLTKRYVSTARQAYRVATRAELVASALRDGQVGFEGLPSPR